MFKDFWSSNQNQINLSLYSLYHAEACITSWRGPSTRHCAYATQFLSKKCRSGGESLATVCPIWPAEDLNRRPPAPERNALPLD